MWNPIQAATLAIVAKTNLNAAQARFLVLAAIIVGVAAGLGLAEANGCACVELLRD